MLNFATIPYSTGGGNAHELLQDKFIRLPGWHSRRFELNPLISTEF